MTSVQDEGAQAARKVRDGYRERFPSAPTIPVDPVRIARDYGIDVFDADLTPNTSGALVKRPGFEPKILLNRTDHPNRKRFTAAHELGHFMRRRENVEEYEYVDLRDPISSTATSPEEMFANAFAAELLMPEDEVRRLHALDYSEPDLAMKFGVSREAMHFRLANLKII